MTGPQQPYPDPQTPPAYPYGPGFGHPVMEPPRRTSTTGPKIAVGTGVTLLLLSVGLFIVGIIAVVRVTPTDVLHLDGSPSSGVVATVDAPGEATVDLPADSAYALYLVRTGTPYAAPEGAAAVTAPDGDAVSVQSPSLSSEVTMGRTHAEAFASFRTDAAGTYRIEAPSTTDGGAAQMLLVPDAGMGTFLGGLFGGVAGILGGVFLGLLALGLLIAGCIMWAVRRGNARRQGIA